MNPRFMLIAIALACGPTANTSKTTPAPPPRTDRWSKLGFEDRHSVMTFTVLPNMARTWRDFQKTPSPEMTCRTCHGKDAEANDYKMPNPSLPHIDPAHPPPGPMTEFMKTRMVPDMINLLGASAEHFGCNTCHVK